MVPFIGPSYNLATRKVDCQRSVNLFPALVESQSGKAPAVLQPVEGLTLFASAAGGAARGCIATDDRAFIVLGAVLYELFSNGTTLARGTLLTASGPVDLGLNTTQLGIVDGVNGYVLDLGTNVLTPIVSAGFYGSARLAMIDGYGVLVRPNSAQFYISAIDDLTTYNPIDFASAEGAPGHLVAVVASHREAWLMKRRVCEVWDDTGAADFPFERIQSAFIEQGTAAPFTLQTVDSTVFWLGQNEDGGGIVWRAMGYNPARISTHAIEEALQSSTDLASSTAYVYQKDGHTFYCLQVPGLSTTLVYDVATQSWHERAEFVNGAYTPHRGVCHMYTFGKHILGGSDGKVYVLDATKNTNNGDALVRDRISPHFATPSYDMQPFAALQIDCNVGDGLPSGQAPLLMMRYSNDGGYTWGNWHTASLGSQGQRRARAIFRRLGEARDRVWMVRCTEDVPFTLIGAAVR